MRALLRCLLPLASPLLLAAPSAAQEKPSDTLLTVQHYLDWETVADPQLSPDGRQIVYTRRWVDRKHDRWESSLWIMDADGGRNRFLVNGSEARWSQDGTRILYLAKGEPEGTQLFVRWMDAEGATTQITRVAKPPQNPRWSPDGRWVAFGLFVEKDEPWKIDLPKPPEGATWTKPPRMVRRVHYRADRRGFLEDGYTHLFLVPAEGGTPRQLTKGDWSVGASGVGLPGTPSFDWVPDGRGIVFAGLLEDADTRYRESHLHLLDVASGQIRQLTREKGPWSGPRVSPDGRWVAFTGYPWTAQSYRAEDLYVMGLDGSGMRLVSRGLDRDPLNLTWAADARGLYFTAEDRGSRNVHHASLEGEVRAVTQGTQVIALTSVARTGVAVGTRSSPHEPGDIVRLDLRRGGAPVELTHVNDEVLERIRLGEVEELWYGSTGDTRVQGWVVKPPDFSPQKNYPLILHIHGGPHAMYNVGFNYSFQNFAANGYLVLYTNPRGSTGYGTAFGNAIDNGYPSVDYDDLMAGVDAVIARGYVDEGRMYVTGCSGGGVLSSWVIGQTDRFAGAGVRCPVINWMSFAGTSDIVNWGYHRYEGYPWTKPEKYLKHSPLMYVQNVKTPTLIMTGELDLRTPMSQSEEYYQALKAVGVPTVLLRFQEEYHGTGSKPSNFMRTQLYLMSWFDKYRKEGAVKAAGPAH